MLKKTAQICIRVICANFVVMQDSRLQSELIARPERWHLGMLISDTELDIAVIPGPEAGADARVVYRHCPFAPEATDRLRAVEDIIYDNPLLLGDFKSVTCLMSHPDYAVMPPMLDAEERREVFDIACPEAGEPVTETMCSNAVMLSAPPDDLVGFLRRTFFQIRIMHPLALTVRSLAAPLAGDSVLAALYGNRVELTLMRGDMLVVTNCMEIRDTADAAYYLLAAMQTFGLSRRLTPVILTSHNSVQAAAAGDMLTPLLSKLEVSPATELPYSLELLRRQLVTQRK